MIQDILIGIEEVKAGKYSEYTFGWLSRYLQDFNALLKN
jgi:hypothetical protein